MKNKVKIIEQNLRYGKPPKWKTEGDVLKVTPTGRHTVSFIRPDNGLKQTKVFNADGSPYPYGYGICRYRMIK